MRKVRGPIVDFLAFVAMVLLVKVLVRFAGLRGGIAATVLFVLCAVAMFWHATLENRAYRFGMGEEAGRMGFRPVDRSDIRLSTYPLRRSGRVRNVFRGKLRDLDAWLFDYSIFDGEDGYAQTVVAFRVEGANLPIFDLRPMGLWTGIVDRRNADDEYFDSVGFSVPCPFELKTSAPEAVERYFTNDLVEKLARIRNWHCVVQGYHTSILCFVPGATIPPKELGTFARRSADVAFEIFSASTQETVSA
jgi:hypothetical protein